MRTTLRIDDDIFAVAKHLAQEEGRSIGAVISSLLRRALQPQRPAPGHVRNGVPVFAAPEQAQPVTLALVNELRDGNDDGQSD
ncbi:MAG: CopG family transcriptional regulator [Polyangiales bacterium]